MKNKIVKKVLAGTLILVFLFFGYNYFFAKTNTASGQIFTEVTAARGTITNTIEVSGTAELADEQELRFNQTGKVTAVYFTSGSTVKKDDVIAELDKTDLENEIKQAEINLQNSRISLQDLLDGNDELDILKAENTLTEAQNKVTTSQTDLGIAQASYESTLADLDRELALSKENVSQKENDLEVAKTNLANEEIYYEDDMKTTQVNYDNTLANGLSSIKGVMIDLDDAFNDINKVLGAEGQEADNNDTFERYLGALNPSDKTQATSYYRSARVMFTEYQTSFAELEADTSLTRDELIAFATDIQKMLDAMTNLADSYYSMLKNTISSTELTESQIESYKSAATSLRSSIKNKSDTMQSLVTSLTNLEEVSTSYLQIEQSLKDKQDAVTSAEYNLKQAQKSLSNLEETYETSKEEALQKVVSAQNTLTSAQNSSTEAQESLQDVLDGSDEKDIQKARNEVTQKELSLENTKENEDQYEIIAPFDGVIRKIDYKVGDNILSDDDKYVYLENPDLLQVKVNLDQIDIISVEEGQEATIVFDALPKVTFEGYVSEVNQAPQTSSSVVTYEVTLTMDKGDAKLFSGMTAEVSIIIEEAEDALTLSSSALSTTPDGKTTVLMKQENGQMQPVEVVTGITDGKTTQIVSGLEEGDVVYVVETVLTDYTSELSSSSSNRGMMGGGMGGGGTPPM